MLKLRTGVLWAATLTLALATGCPEGGDNTATPSMDQATPTASLPQATPSATATQAPSPTATPTATRAPTPTPTATATPYPDRDEDGAPADIDCDDQDPHNFEGNTEVCDGGDNDCDFSADEGVSQTYYADVDDDGFGDPNVPQAACEAPDDFVDNGEDCDDDNAAAFPEGDELCDGFDGDCDATVDEGVQTLYYADGDGDGVGDETTTLGACTLPDGYVEISGDCDDGDGSNFPGNDETCDGGDNDCDFGADEGVTTAYYADIDGDSFGNKDMATFACTLPDGLVENNLDCDDLDATKYPGNDEICDLKDNDCDTPIDEGVTSPFHPDADGDGAGDADITTYACAQPDGHVVNADDCDDGDNTIYLGADELCDTLDQDCDEAIDEAPTDPTTFYADTDGDTFGDPDVNQAACEAPQGYTPDDQDCDDTDADIHPDADEFCDNIDENCDGGLIPCTADLSFDDNADGDHFTFEHNGCTPGGVEDGSLNVSCPNNNDLTYWFEFNCPPATRIHITTEVFVGPYLDAGPRNGIDFGTGFGAWGPNPGYAFFMADPHDGTQGDACGFGDTCPSITLNNSQMGDIASVQTTADTVYYLDVVLDDSGEFFDLSFPYGDDAEQTVSMETADLNTRAGQIGLHCGESICRFGHFFLEVE